MPATDLEMAEYASGPADGEEPFFSLLADDRLISRVSVATDMLLQPIEGTEHDARLVIDVEITPYRVTYANIGFV